MSNGLTKMLCQGDIKNVLIEYSLTEQNKVLKSNSKTVFIDLIFNFGTICI